MKFLDFFFYLWVLQLASGEADTPDNCPICDCSNPDADPVIVDPQDPLPELGPLARSLDPAEPVPIEETEAPQEMNDFMVRSILSQLTSNLNFDDYFPGNRNRRSIPDDSGYDNYDTQDNPSYDSYDTPNNPSYDNYDNHHNSGSNYNNKKRYNNNKYNDGYGNYSPQLADPWWYSVGGPNRKLSKYNLGYQALSSLRKQFDVYGAPTLYTAKKNPWRKIYKPIYNRNRYYNDYYYH